MTVVDDIIKAKGMRILTDEELTKLVDKILIDLWLDEKVISHIVGKVKVLDKLNVDSKSAREIIKKRLQILHDQPT